MNRKILLVGGIGVAAFVGYFLFMRIPQVKILRTDSGTHTVVFEFMGKQYTYHANEGMGLYVNGMIYNLNVTSSQVWSSAKYQVKFEISRGGKIVLSYPLPEIV